MANIKLKVNKTDLANYIQIKDVEDYTYNDMLMTLKNKNCESLPFTFIQYMGRMIEDTMIRIYTDKHTSGYTIKNNKYLIPEEDNYLVHVRYRTHEWGYVVQYKIKEVVIGFDYKDLEYFETIYMDRVVENLLTTSKSLDVSGESRREFMVTGAMFQIISKINSYIHYRNQTEEVNDSVLIREKVRIFMEKYKEEASKRNREVIPDLENYLIANFGDITIY